MDDDGDPGERCPRVIQVTRWTTLMIEDGDPGEKMSRGDSGE